MLHDRAWKVKLDTLAADGRIPDANTGARHVLAGQALAEELDHSPRHISSAIARALCAPDFLEQLAAQMQRLPPVNSVGRDNEDARLGGMIAERTTSRIYAGLGKMIAERVTLAVDALFLADAEADASERAEVDDTEERLDRLDRSRLANDIMRGRM